MQVGLTVEELRHLPHDGPVPPGTVPDEVHAWVAQRGAHGLRELNCMSQLSKGPCNVTCSKVAFKTNLPV